MGYLGLTPTTAQQNYLNIDDISGSFDGSTTSFALQVGSVAPTPFPVTNSCLISVGGVIQEPDDTGTSGFRISGGNIVFSSAPGTGEDFFGLILAGADYLNIGANFPDGTVGTPSITFDSDTNTGIYHPSADELSFVTGGSDRVRVDSNGRLGIGTTSPGSYNANADELVVVGASSSGITLASGTVNSGNIYFADGTTGDDQIRGAVRYLHSTNSMQFNTNATTALTIDSSQRVGIGTTSPTNRIHSYASNNAARTDHIRLQNDGADNGTESAIIFTQNSATEQACIFSSKDASGPSLNIEISGAQMGRFTNNGQFIVGTVPSSLPTSTLVVEGASDGTDGNPILHFSRKKTIGSATGLGLISFGKNDNVGARIYGISQGTWSEGSSHPTDLVFETVQNSSTTLRPVLKLTREGELNVNDFANIYNSDGYTNSKLFVYDDRTGGHVANFVNNNNAYGQSNHGVFWSGCTRSATSSYVLYAGTSGNGSSLNYGADYEFRLYGDGNGKCDGSWTGGGADYAEMFEWVDGNPDAEDRRGLSVVLEGNKIRTAVDGEDPIGVISANPTILGDAAWNKWTEKHLRDDFGSYIWQEHNVVEWTDEEGKKINYEDWNIPADVVVPDDAITMTHDENGKRFAHRAVNPDYDPDREYVPREERQEWDAVGLMGKLRIRKGQVTGARWIKMRDISDNVEEWLVR